MKPTYGMRIILAALTTFLLGATLAGCDKPQESIEDVIAQAESAEDKGDLQAAAILYKNVLQRNPEHRAARLRLGRVYLALGDGASAEKELKIAMEGGTLPLSDIAVDLVTAQLFQEKYGELTQDPADSALVKIQTLAGSNEAKAGDLMALYGHAYLFQGKVEDATKMYRSALKVNDRTADAYLGEAMLQAGKSDFPGAKASLQKATKLKPSLASAWSYLGDIERYEGNLEASEQAYSQAINLRLNHAHDLYGRSLARIGLAQLDAAREDAKSLMRLQPRSPSGPYLTGVIALRENRFQQAMEDFEKALSFHLDYAPAMLYAGITAGTLDRLEVARQYLSSFLAKSPSNTLALKNLAVVQLRSRDYAAARESAERVLEIEAGDDLALAILGTVAMGENRGSEAVDLFQQLVQQSPESADAYLKLGLAFAVEGRSEQAVEALRKAAGGDSAGLESKIALVVAYVRNKQLDQALRAAEDLERGYPDSVPILDLVGRIRMLQGDKESAKGRFRRALELDPADFRAASSLANMAVEEGDLQGARGYYEGVLRAQPDHLQAGLALAGIAVRQGQSNQARDILEAVRKGNPTAWQPHAVLAEHYRALGEPVKAIALLSEISGQHPANPLVWQELGKSQLAAGQTRDAIDSLRRFAELMPADANAHYLLAQAYAAGANLTDAAKQLEETLRLDPGHIGAKKALIRIALANGDTVTAAHLVDELIAVRPNEADAVMLQGAVAMARKEPTNAIALYEKAFRLAPAPATLTALAYAQIAAGQQEGGLKALSGWLDAYPEDAVVRHNLASAARILGRADLAAREYQVLVDQRRADASVYNNLALISLPADSEKALQQITAGLEKDPISPRLLDTLGLVQMKRQDFDRALQAFERAADRAADDPSITYHKAAAMERLGKTQEAESVLSTLLASDVEFTERSSARTLFERLRKERLASGGRRPEDAPK